MIVLYIIIGIIGGAVNVNTTILYKIISILGIFLPFIIIKFVLLKDFKKLKNNNNNYKRVKSDMMVQLVIFGILNCGINIVLIIVYVITCNYLFNQIKNVTY